MKPSRCGAFTILPLTCPTNFFRNSSWALAFAAHHPNWLCCSLLSRQKQLPGTSFWGDRMVQMVSSVSEWLFHDIRSGLQAVVWRAPLLITGPTEHFPPIYVLLRQFLKFHVRQFTCYLAGYRHSLVLLSFLLASPWTFLPPFLFATPVFRRKCHSKPPLEADCHGKQEMGQQNAFLFMYRSTIITWFMMNIVQGTTFGCYMAEVHRLVNNLYLWGQNERCTLFFWGQDFIYVFVDLFIKACLPEMCRKWDRRYTGSQLEKKCSLKALWKIKSTKHRHEAEFFTRNCEAKTCGVGKTLTLGQHAQILFDLSIFTNQKYQHIAVKEQIWLKSII